MERSLSTTSAVSDLRSAHLYADAHGTVDDVGVGQDRAFLVDDQAGPARDRPGADQPWRSGPARSSSILTRTRRSRSIRARYSSQSGFESGKRL